MEGTTDHQCEQCDAVFTSNRVDQHAHDKVKKNTYEDDRSKKIKDDQSCYPTIAKAIGLPTIEEVRRTDVPFEPILLKSTPGGNAAQWTIEFHDDDDDDEIDPYISLSIATKTMKATIFEHSYRHTYQLKFHFALHIVFVRDVKDPTGFTKEALVESRTERVFLADLFDIDDIFERHVEELIEKIESFQKNGRSSSRWEIHHLVRLDTHIISIDPLRGFVNAPDFVW